MRAFVDAAVKLELENVKLYQTRFTPLVLPELTRLVSAGAIRELDISGLVASLFEDAASMAAFCDAVRASTMRRLVFEPFFGVPPCENVQALMTVINARHQMCSHNPLTSK